MAASWDVVVCGAGPAGAATALLLARGGVRVCLVEAQRFPREKPCGEAMGPGVRSFFQRHGFSAPPGHSTLRGIRLQAGRDELFIPYRADGREALGFGACRADLDARLLAAALEVGVELRAPLRVLGLEREPGGTALVVARGRGRERLRATFVVGAGGLGCPLARALGRRRGPGRIALVAHAEDIDSLGSHGEAHLVDRGFVGIAPLGPRAAGVGVVLDRASARALRAADLARAWRAGLERAGLAERFASARLASPVRSTGPLDLARGRPIAPGVALVGDAAGFVDPFTGDGVALALSGAERLAAAILDTPDPARALHRYERGWLASVWPRLALDLALRRAAARPALARRLVRTLAARPDLAERLLAVPADLKPVASLLSPAFFLPLGLALLRGGRAVPEPA